MKTYMELLIIFKLIYYLVLARNSFVKMICYVEIYLFLILINFLYVCLSCLF